MRYHLHRIGSEAPYFYSDLGYSDLSQHEKILNEPSVWEIKEGSPPEGAKVYIEKTLQERLSDALDFEIEIIRQNSPALLTGVVLEKLMAMEAQVDRFLSRSSLASDVLALEELINQFDDGGNAVLLVAKQRVITLLNS